MLPRSQRLVAAVDHRLVARRGLRARRGFLVVKCVLDGADQPGPARVAVVVPRAAGTAPVRNRLRRRLQNLVAGRMSTFPGGSRTVVRAEPGAADLTFEGLRSSLDAALAAVTSAPGGRPQ